MKSYITLFLLIFISSFACAVPEAQKQKVQDDVKLTISAVYKGDVDVVLKYTNPKIIEMMGGDVKARETLKGIFASFAKKDMKLISFKFTSNPSFFEGSKNHFVFVPTLSVISVSGQLVESLNFQLGIRPKDSNVWTYIEGSRITKENILMFASDFPNDVDLPKFYRKKISAEVEASDR